MGKYFPRQEHKKHHAQLRRAILIAAIAVSATVFLFCAWRLTDVWLEYRTGDTEYASLKSYAPPEVEASPVNTQEQADTGTEASLPIMDFTDLIN